MAGVVSGSIWVSALLHGSSNYFIQVLYPTLTIQTPEGDAMLGEFGWFAPIISGAIAVVFWCFRSRIPNSSADRERPNRTSEPASKLVPSRGSS